jgi:hypothetical protein
MPDVAFFLPCGGAPRRHLRVFRFELRRMRMARRRFLAPAAKGFAKWAGKWVAKWTAMKAAKEPAVEERQRPAGCRCVALVGCHEIRRPAPHVGHTTNVRHATSFPTRGRRDIDRCQPQWES